jgi:hypothetical protein
METEPLNTKLINTVMNRLDTTDAWHTFDPVGLLRRLIAVTDARALAGHDALNHHVPL